MDLKKTLLIVENDLALRVEYVEYFTSCGWIVHSFATVEAAWEAVETLRFDVALLDHSLSGDETGTEFGKRLKERFGDKIRVVIYSALTMQEVAEEAGSGVDGFIPKGACDDWDASANYLERMYQDLRLHASARSPAFPLVVDSSSEEDFFLEPHSQRIQYAIKKYIGPSLSPVLILGETGTGKERAARMIHEASGLPRSNFRVINCAAFPRDLIMSELFGHVAGAFTGAFEHRLGIILEAAGATTDVDDHAESSVQIAEVLGELVRMTRGDVEYLVREVVQAKGEKEGTFYRRVKEVAKVLDDLRQIAKKQNYVAWLQRCGNQLVPNEVDMCYDLVLDGLNESCTGTLFLDEIADLDESAQAAVLRFLDGYGIRPVGYFGRPIRPRVRVIAATNKTEILGLAPGEPAGSGSKGSAAFRTDLFWRLNGWIINMPPLRDRAQDALAAAQRQIARFNEQRRCNLQLNPDARERLLRMITDDTAPQFSDTTNRLRSGNFRHLRAVIDRACWLAYQRDRQGGRISVELLDAAANPMDLQGLIDLPVHHPRVEVTEPISTDRVTPSAGSAVAKAAVAEQLIQLSDRARVHDPLFYAAEDGNLALDLALSAALNDYLNDPRSEFTANELLRTPERCFGVAAPLASTALQRWQCMVVLAALALARRNGEEYTWKSCRKALRAERTDVDNLKQRVVPGILGAYEIRVLWRDGKSRRMGGDLNDLVRLIHGGVATLLDANGQEKSKDVNLFAWKSPPSDEARRRTDSFLRHLARLADHLDLRELDSSAGDDAGSDGESPGGDEEP